MHNVLISPTARGLVLALVGFSAFSLHDGLVKTLHGLSVFQIVFFAMLWSYVPFSVALTLDRTPKTLRPVQPGWVLGRALSSVAGVLFAFYAFSVLPMSEAYALLFLSPLFISLLAVPILGERIGWWRAIAIGLGLLGVLIVLRPDGSSLHWGHLAGACAAGCSSVSSIISRRVGNQENAFTMILFPLLFSILVAGLLLSFDYTPMSLLQVWTLLAIGSLGLIGQVCLLLAYRSAPAAYVAPFQYSQMLWAIFYGLLWFDEHPDRYVWIGSAIIFLSGTLIVWRETAVSHTKPNLRSGALRAVLGPALRRDPHDSREKAQAE